MSKPLIALLLDENTSEGGGAYTIGKRYFEAVSHAGGRAVGIPFDVDMVEWAVAHCDGLLCPGGRFSFLPEHYAYGLSPLSPNSDRLSVEMALIAGFLKRNKPILGICSGMQLLGCMHGAKMTPDLCKTEKAEATHDEAGRIHQVTVSAGTKLSEVIGATTIDVNSYHREALVSVGENTIVSARADDGIIEAIELPAYRFALGVQWHPERKDLPQNPSNKLFAAFIDACS